MPKPHSLHVAHVVAPELLGVIYDHGFSLVSLCDISMRSDAIRGVQML